MRPAPRQGELFAADSHSLGDGALAPAPPPLLREQLLAWQERVAAHQGPLHRGEGVPEGQLGFPFLDPQAPQNAAIEPMDLERLAALLAPLSLSPQSLSFWRWPSAPQRGAAVYLVMDRPQDPLPPLLLYVGESGRADRRWKGDHDCKGYLAAYGEALRRAGLEARLSIRFWCDVPVEVRPRRALEQALIRRWLPPFNKESRERWATPFTADPP